jgi:hypothetical protein
VIILRRIPGPVAAADPLPRTALQAGIQGGLRAVAVVAREQFLRVGGLRDEEAFGQSVEAEVQFAENELVIPFLVAMRLGATILTSGL